MEFMKPLTNTRKYPRNESHGFLEKVHKVPITMDKNISTQSDIIVRFECLEKRKMLKLLER